MLLNHPAPGEDGFALGMLTSLGQVLRGRGEVLQGGLQKSSPFGGKIPGKRCLACPGGQRVGAGGRHQGLQGAWKTLTAFLVGSPQWASCRALVLASVKHLIWRSSELFKVCVWGGRK